MIFSSARMNPQKNIFVWVTPGVAAHQPHVKVLCAIVRPPALRQKTVLAMFREEHRHGNRPIGIWDKQGQTIHQMRTAG